MTALASVHRLARFPRTTQTRNRKSSEIDGLKNAKQIAGKPLGEFVSLDHGDLMTKTFANAAIVILSGVAAFHTLFTAGVLVVLFLLPETSVLNEYRGPIRPLDIGNPGFLILQLAVGALMSISWLAATYLRHRITLLIAVFVLCLQVLVTGYEVLSGRGAETSLYRYDWVSVSGGVLLFAYSAALGFWKGFQSARV